MEKQRFDVAVIGAGAAGMMCAAVAGQGGKRVVLIDHATKLAEKIRISGGGRCNFTNLQTNASHFLSENKHFCKNNDHHAQHTYIIVGRETHRTQQHATTSTILSVILGFATLSMHTVSFQ